MWLIKAQFWKVLVEYGRNFVINFEFITIHCQFGRALNMIKEVLRNFGRSSSKTKTKKKVLKYFIFG